MCHDHPAGTAEQHEESVEADDGQRIEQKPADFGWSLKLYREIARASDLTHGEYRTLDALLSFADWSTADGEPEDKAVFGRTAGSGGNCFPERRKIAAAIGKSMRMTDQFLAGLERKNWIRRIPFIRLTDGKRTTDVFQFRIPAASYSKHLGKLHLGPPTGLDGPLDWSKRKYVLPLPNGHSFWKGRDES